MVLFKILVCDAVPNFIFSYDSLMLLNTFRHLKGIGKKSEISLWEKGITDWEKYLKVNGNQLTIFKNQKRNPILSSINAYKKGDIHFFARTLPHSEYYRIALTYPGETLFLDIETTGLSIYYDYLTLVGWSLGQNYGVCFWGQDATSLISVLKSAKAIVTFNGSLFDLKFLRKTFPDIYIPPVHIDLRFFARRVGLSGGQKKIEPEVGFERPDSVKEMGGESAPILWYKYRRGDKKSLKQLINYNHADVEGMKWILDHSIDQIYAREKIPDNIRSNAKFSNLQSKIRWIDRKPRNSDPYQVYLSKDIGSPKPLITFEELNSIVSLSDLTTVGIDLVSSEERESGYCILKGNHALTSRIKTDAEMIQQAIDAGANLVSIDSPLSIPKGRTSFFDDDPSREQFGIMRECERILKRRGINVYPCLIPSMQKLTRRGMGLAEKFRKLGITVIESYPGAAQDILAIPRKRAGLKYLADALLEFGIFDNFTERKISHDELDAITSAIVGIFFWAGKFEALGNEDEEYLIVPETNRNSSLWADRKIIGLSGPIAAGKTTASYFLRDQGFDYGRFSLVLENILRERDIQPSRRELQDFGNEINMMQKQRWLAKKLVRELPNHGNLVIDGLRHPEDHAFLAEAFGPAFLHIHIISPESIRLSRYISEGKTKEEFIEASNHPVESNVPLMASLAHVIMENTGDIKNLKKKTLKTADVNKQK
jgi:predicted nuclease with RNAse H fold/uncharacterized protein YprB with RNaseH-like and TPR domain/dephospho-CoA kinase